MSRPTPTRIAVRCYTEVLDSKPVGGKAKRSRLDQPSEWVLVFDCETTIDASQTLRVGVFQIRKKSELSREGLFFDAESLSDTDIATILAYAEAKDLEALSVTPSAGIHNANHSGVHTLRCGEPARRGAKWGKPCLRKGVSGRYCSIGHTF